MNKKIRVLFAILSILIIAGCGNTKELSKDKTKTDDSKSTCSINNNGDYWINESMICPQFKDINSSGDRFFITNSGELYEYSDKKYSSTDNNCRKVETDVLFDKVVMNTIISKDGNFYSFHDGNLKKITNDEIEKGRGWYGIDQMEIKLYKTNNNIFYLFTKDLSGTETYVYVDNNNIYSVYYDYETNKISENLLYTLKNEEIINNITNGYITTNKGYYRYGVINQKECSEYADIKCEYGLVLVDTIDNCSNEIFYISNELIVTKKMVK